MCRETRCLWTEVEARIPYKSRQTNDRWQGEVAIPWKAILDAAAVNGNYAASAGLNPVTDAIAMEDAKGPYANLIAVRVEDKDQAWVAKLYDSAYAQSTEDERALALVYLKRWLETRRE